MASFLLSAIVITSAALTWLRGAMVELLPPEQVAILRHTYPSGLEVVRLSARMAYLNRARPEFSDAIRQERIEFTFGAVRYRQLWQHFVRFRPTKDDPLGLEVLQDAHPQQIAGGTTSVHETYFAPRTRWGNGADPSHDFVGWSVFAEAVGSMKTLDFDLIALTYSGRELRVRCTVNVSGLVKTLRDKGWTAPSCVNLPL